LYEHEPKLQALLEERLGALQELIGAYRSQGNYEAAKAVRLRLIACVLSLLYY
jgi:hypothetical protein